MRVTTGIPITYRKFPPRTFIQFNLVSGGLRAA